jgi:hypothetical protein
MTGLMTPVQFYICTTLSRSEVSPTQNAARMVLVDGIPNCEAADANPPTSPQSVSQATRRIQKAHSLILSGYGPVPETELPE